MRRHHRPIAIALCVVTVALVAIRPNHAEPQANDALQLCDEIDSWFAQRARLDPNLQGDDHETLIDFECRALRLIRECQLAEDGFDMLDDVRAGLLLRYGRVAGLLLGSLREREPTYLTRAMIDGVLGVLDELIFDRETDWVGMEAYLEFARIHYYAGDYETAWGYAISVFGLCADYFGGCSSEVMARHERHELEAGLLAIAAARAAGQPDEMGEWMDHLRSMPQWPYYAADYARVLSIEAAPPIHRDALVRDHNLEAGVQLLIESEAEATWASLIRGGQVVSEVWLCNNEPAPGSVDDGSAARPAVPLAHVRKDDYVTIDTADAISVEWNRLGQRHACLIRYSHKLVAVLVVDAVSDRTRKRIGLSWNVARDTRWARRMTPEAMLRGLCVVGEHDDGVFASDD